MITLEIGIHSSTGREPWPDGQPRSMLGRALVKAIPVRPGTDQMLTLAAVADTVGGVWARQHQLESYPPAQLVVDTILDAFAHDDPAPPLRRLASSFEVANRRLLMTPNAQATCAAVMIHNQKLYMALHGACRVFLLHEGEVKRISYPGTMAEILMEMGFVTVEELMHSPYHSPGSVKLLGVEWDEEFCDLRLRLSPNESDESARANQGFLLRDGDQIVLTSYNVFWDYIEPDEDTRFRATFLDPTLSAQAAVDHFIAPLRERHTRFDLSMIVLRIHE